MLGTRSMRPAIVAHTLVAAHAGRVAELARLHDQLERAVAAGGAHGAVARAVHRALCARIIEWNGIDLEAERRDVVPIAAAEREAMRHTVGRAIAHVRSTLADLPATAH